jgi:hypothetical protein
MLRTSLATVALIALVAPALAQGPDRPAYGHGYTIAKLFEPCDNADNDDRWGVGAEIECEQYLVGYTDAFLRLADAAGEEVCPSEPNRPTRPAGRS